VNDDGCSTCLGCGCLVLLGFVIIPALASGAPLLLIPLIAFLLLVSYGYSRLVEWFDSINRRY
jgi:hypothetical protein